MNKITLLRGLPGSGKSSFAKKLVEESDNVLRVSKDSIRQMLYFYAKDKRNLRRDLERKVVQVEDMLIKYLLDGGFDIIVDDTNLSLRHERRIRGIAKPTGQPVEVYEMPTPVEECIERDRAREQSVGAGIIKSMAYRAGLLERESLNKKIELEGKYVLCDMDGTLADCEHRVHFLESEQKDWVSFFEDMRKDTLRQEVLDIAMNFNLPIVIVTARPESYRQMTEEWLDRCGIVRAGVLMRKDGDYRPDAIIKLEILDTFLEKSKIECVIDDRPAVIRAWESRGLKVIDVSLRKKEF